MANYTMMLASLAAPFEAKKVHWRVGATNRDKTKGVALAYIDARDVMERLDEVCGPAGWGTDYPDAGNGKTCCRIGLNIDGEWVWKANGAGDTQFEGDKGAFSDAFKRAAVLWGIGRYLYDLPAPWVDIEERGRSYSIAQSEYPKLDKMLNDLLADVKREDSMGEEFDERVVSNGRQRSGHQAKKDGDGTIVEEMEQCLTVDALDAWFPENEHRISTLPVSWQNKFWSRFDEHRDSLSNKERTAA